MSESIILTGSTGNLGQTVSSVLKEKGYRVLATTSSERGVNALEEKGIQGFQVDLMNEQSVHAFIDSITDYNPRGAVLLAGGFTMNGIESTSFDDLEHMIQMNIKTAYVIVNKLLAYFAEKGGQFILIGAKPGLDASLGHQMAAYSLSKGMIFHLSELINAYGKGKNIHSTVLVPGVIDTAANREAMPDADTSSWTSPGAIAETIAFLLGPGKEVRDSVIKLYND